WATRRSRRRPSPKRSRSPRLLRSRKRSPSGSDSEVDPENWTTRDVKLIGVHCSIPRSTMKGTRKRYSAAFKARVALEAAKQTEDPRRAVQVVPGPPGPDQAVEKAAPGRCRVVVPRRPQPRPGREPGPAGRTLSTDRPVEHGGRLVVEKPARFG